MNKGNVELRNNNENERRDLEILEEILLILIHLA